MIEGWIGVDLDGTLAHYDGWKGWNHIGEPIPRMVALVRSLVDKGCSVKIFTARMADARIPAERFRIVLRRWLERAGLPPRLEATAVKDMHCQCIYDDRAISVIANTGRTRDESSNLVVDFLVRGYNGQADIRRNDPQEPAAAE